MIDKNEFYFRVKQLGAIASKTGTASYSHITTNNNIAKFKRDNTQKYWDIDLDKLYAIYLKENFFNTTVIKREMGGRVNSPSIAILMAIGACDKSGFKIKGNQ